ncbi:serine threonine protein kinase, CMGC group [Xylaria sp. CBS 124048]|nr:serine threonine protein kinase, CMGC group [Xylaria sp. CBS 124048]
MSQNISFSHFHVVRWNWKPVKFGAKLARRIPFNTKVEEETLPGYHPTRYYPVSIGRIFAKRYQVVGKLGYGTTSTVWLARDLCGRCHVVLKFLTNKVTPTSREVKMYELMKKRGTASHIGRDAVRQLLDTFKVRNAYGVYRVLVHPPLWQSVKTFLDQKPAVIGLNEPVLAFVLYRLLLGLSYLHTECSIIHGDIKLENIMFTVGDNAVFRDYEKEEQKNPSPKKEYHQFKIYKSRELPLTRRLGPAVLCDLGDAVPADEARTEILPPNIYRAPEALLHAPWTHKLDIWSAGCVAWELFGRTPLFSGQDPELDRYERRAHIAEMIALLGRPDSSALAKGEMTSQLFSQDTMFTGGIPVPDAPFLDELTNAITVNSWDAKGVFDIMRPMLQWDSHSRASAEDLMASPWLRSKIYANAGRAGLLR